MSTTPVEPAVTPTEPPAAAATSPAPTDPPVADPASPWADPLAAQAEIERLRKENAKDRTTAKAQAAEDAKREYAQTIAKALGLVPDDANDPAKLTESLTAAQADARRAQVELAVFRNATTAGGDPAALLDSAKFLTDIAAIDPTDTAAVTAAIEAAVTANPRLGAAPADPAAPQPPAPNPAQGAGGNGIPSLDDQIAAAQAARDFRTVILLKNEQAAAHKTKS